MSKLRILVFAVLAGVVGSAAGQEGADTEENSFGRAAMSVQEELREKLDELARLRERIEEERIPLSKQLRELERKRAEVRDEYQRISRQVDKRDLDLSNLQREIKAREKEAGYLSNLLSGYIRELDGKLHVAEKQRYEDVFEAAYQSPDNDKLSRQEVYEAQTDVVAASLDRLEDALSGARFAGTAVVEGDVVQDGMFVMFGPTALFRSIDGESVGTVQERRNSTKPWVVPFSDPENMQAAAEVVRTGRGSFPFDPTLGKAHKQEQTETTLWEHIRKGGPLMIPILGLGGMAVLIALYKWATMAFVRKPRQRQIGALLGAIAKRDERAVRQKLAAIRGPVGEMLAIGVEHIREPVDLIEEVMYEKMLSVRLKLQGLLPLIRISAAAAPLLGLLGTVAGIITTFRRITEFGSGDAQMLSGGISVALITTEFGLIVAITSLLMHALLSRKARGLVDEMEKAGVGFANQVRKTPFEEEGREAEQTRPASSEGPGDVLEEPLHEKPNVETEDGCEPEMNEVGAGAAEPSTRS